MSVLLVLLLLTAEVHVVDDNGLADFTDIQPAIDAAQPGDTLVVHVGSYSGFVLGKRLTLVGQDGPLEPFVGTEPFVGGVTLIEAPAGFTLAGMRLFSLEVEGVAGPGVVDDCTVLRGVEAGGCQQLLFERLLVPQAQVGVPGLRVSASTVMLVGSELTGGAGDSPFAGHGGDGTPGLDVAGGSLVVVAGTRLTGGNAGVGSAGDGLAGDALRCNGSTVLVRGTSADVLDDGSFDPGFGGGPGHAIACAGGLVIHSGVTLAADVSVTAGGVVQQAAQPEPWLEVVGDDLPGSARSIDLYGPAGAPALLVASAAPGLFTLPKLELPLFLQPAGALAIVPLSLSGAEVPTVVGFTVPTTTGWAGAVLRVQAVHPSLSSTWQPGDEAVSNAAAIVLRY